MENQVMVSKKGGLSCEGAPSLQEESIKSARQLDKKLPVKADGVDRLFAGIYLLIGYGFVFTFTSAKFERNLALYTVVYAAVVIGYIMKKGRRPGKESYFWLCILLAAAVPYAFWSLMPGFQVMAVIFLAAYWTLQMTGSFMEGFKTSQWMVADSLNALVIVPFTNSTCQFKVLKDSIGKEKRGNTAAGKLCAVILGLILAIPILILVFPLLSRADAGFENLAAGGVLLIGEYFPITFLRVLLSIPVAGYLFGLVYGGIYKRNTGSIDRERVQKTGKCIRIVPDIAICTAVIAVCMVYLLFMVIQGKYLFSAFCGTMPQTFTYAEYARRGFFELCGVASLNLLLLFGANLLSGTERSKNVFLRIMNILLAVLTVLLVLTAMSKMVLYISAYGLTTKRILTMAFMIWLTIVFTQVVLWQKKEVPIIRNCIMAGAVIFSLLCLLPVQGGMDYYNQQIVYSVLDMEDKRESLLVLPTISKTIS